MKIFWTTSLLLIFYLKHSNAANATSPAPASPAPAQSAPDSKEKPALLNSYLPAAMQVLAHLTNQMKVAQAKPAVSTTTSTTQKPTTTTTTAATTTTTTTTTEKPTTASSDDPSSTTTTTETPVASSSNKPTEAQSSPQPETTPPHSPAIFAPPIPPAPVNLKTPLDLPVETPFISPIVHEQKPLDFYQPLYLPNQPHHDFIPPVISVPNHQFFVRNPQPILDTSFPVITYQSYPNSYFHLPPEFPPHFENSDYSGLYLQSRTGEDSLPDISSLPVQNENNYKVNPLELEPDELSSENLQYLSPVVRELLQSIHGPVDDDFKLGNPTASFQSIEDLYDEGVEKENIHSWLRLEKGTPAPPMIQMLLLYDMLSRDAKDQKLNKYNGFTPEVIGDLNDISDVSAADQLQAVLSRMVARGDCKNDFTNKRAMDLAKELQKEESNVKSQLKDLKPLRYEKL